MISTSEGAPKAKVLLPSPYTAVSRGWGWHIMGGIMGVAYLGGLTLVLTWLMAGGLHPGGEP